MKEIFESWLGIVLLALLMIGGISIINAGIEARNADATKAGYIAEIEASNFSSDVLQSVLTEAETAGYDISFDLYRQAADGTRTVTEAATGAATIGDTADVYMVRMSLGFSYSFALFDVAAHHELIGYAR